MATESCQNVMSKNCMWLCTSSNRVAMRTLTLIIVIQVFGFLLLLFCVFQCLLVVEQKTRSVWLQFVINTENGTELPPMGAWSHTNLSAYSHACHPQVLLLITKYGYKIHCNYLQVKMLRTAKISQYQVKKKWNKTSGMQLTQEGFKKAADFKKPWQWMHIGKNVCVGEGGMFVCFCFLWPVHTHFSYTSQHWCWNARSFLSLMIITTGRKKTIKTVSTKQTEARLSV